MSYKDIDYRTCKKVAWKNKKLIKKLLSNNNICTEGRKFVQFKDLKIISSTK